MAESRVTGRPRSETSRVAILEAATALLAEKGWSAFALETVASRAKVGKSTIYRWWRTKAQLAIEAFRNDTEEELRFPDTGSAQEDFRVQITELARLLRGERGQAFAAMLAGARSDPELARTLNDEWREPRRRWGFARMQRAQADGEVNDGVEIGPALGSLYGALYAPLLFGQPMPTEREVDAHLRLVLPAIFSR